MPPTTRALLMTPTPDDPAQPKRACEPRVISDPDAPSQLNAVRSAVGATTTLAELAVLCERFGLSLHVMRAASAHWVASVASLDVIETARGMDALEAISGAVRAWVIAQGAALEAARRG